MKVLHEWLRDFVGDAMPETKQFEELFTFHAFEIDGVETVAGKEVIDVKVLPDRGADCLSHRGIARELATLTGAPLTDDPLAKSASFAPITEKIKIAIENPENCRRFAGALMTGVTVKESPEWLKSRLEALGQRSINNIVDATNYVMLGLGQPLHAYDAGKFPSRDGVWHFGVRMAKDGEEVTILGGESVELTPAVQVITEAEGDTPVGIAGVKGGQSAEIDGGTTSIILEAASFNPQVTRRGAQAVRLGTDASKRFENNLSPELVPYALSECVRLIQEIAGGTCKGYADVHPKPTRNEPVSVTLAHTNALLGLALTADTVENIFTRLGFSSVRTKEGWSVTAPFERRDIVIPADVIAEIGRVHGYEHVASVLPLPVPLTEVNARHFYSEEMRNLLVGEGFSEVITSSFRKKDTIELANALASDKGCLRSSLSENIREVLNRNIQNVDLLGIREVSVFEIGTVFEKTPDGADVAEHVSLAVGVRTKQTGYSPKDDERVREVLSKLETFFGVALHGTILQGILEIDFTKLIAKLPAPAVYEPFVPEADITFKPFSQYPHITRDIAFWAPESVTAGEIETVLKERAGALLVRIGLFDEFRKDGRVSYAFRLVFQALDRTLTDEEVGTITDTLYGELKNRGFEVR